MAGKEILFKPSSLPKGSEQWARQVEGGLNELLRLTARNDQSAERGASTGAASIDALSRQVVELAEAQRSLAETQADLAEAQQGLSQAQQGIANALAEVQRQQAYLASLRPVNNSSSASLTGISGGWTNNNALRPSVTTTTTANGKIRIGLSAAIVGCYGAFSITSPSGFSFSRDFFSPSSPGGVNTLFNANTSGTAATREWYADVPAGIQVTVTAEFYSLTPQAQVAYPNISLQNVS